MTRHCPSVRKLDIPFTIPLKCSQVLITEQEAPTIRFACSKKTITLTSLKLLNPTTKILNKTKIFNY